MGDLAAALRDRRKNERAKRDARMAKATVQEGAKNKRESGLTALLSVNPLRILMHAPVLNRCSQRSQ